MYVWRTAILELLRVRGLDSGQGHLNLRSVEFALTLRKSLTWVSHFPSAVGQGDDLTISEVPFLIFYTALAPNRRSSQPRKGRGLVPSPGLGHETLCTANPPSTGTLILEATTVWPGQLLCVTRVAYWLVVSWGQVIVWLLFVSLTKLAVWWGHTKIPAVSFTIENKTKHHLKGITKGQVNINHDPATEDNS